MRSSANLWAFFASAALAFSFGVPTTALAHPLVDEGISRYEGADFQGALASFDEAEAATDLTRSDLVELLEGRALAHLALGAEDDMSAALRQLASLDPERQMGRAIPPPMREAFDQIRAGATMTLAVEVSAEPVPGGVRLDGRVRGDDSGLVRELRLSGRAASGEWRSGPGPTFDVVTSAGETVQYYAEAVGPGGAILATSGTRAAPLTYASSVGAGTSDGAGLGDDDGGGLLVPILIGAGAVALLAAVIILVVVATSGAQSEETQFSAPMWSP